jgi:hypothetical protein
MKCNPDTHRDNKHCDPVTRSDNNERDPVCCINIKQNGQGQQPKIEEDQDILNDDDRKPAAVLFATSGKVTHPLVATTGNDTQSLAATASDVAQSLAATASDVSQSTVAATDSDIAQSLTAMASNVAQSTVAATGSVAHSTSFTEANTEAELTSFSPDIIAEDAAAREMLLEMPPLSLQVIETLLTIFHPIICLQLLTILPFIHGWLQMMLPLEKNWKKIPKQRRF